MEIEKGTALVLGGGGVTGIAWMLGLLTALKQAGVDVTGAELVVGTSAGSVVGAQITSGKDLEEYYAAQLVDPSQTGERAVEFDAEKFQQIMINLVREIGFNPQALRAGLGKLALTAETVPEEVRLDIIRSRLPSQEWPDRKLLINAVDAENGDWQVFDRDSEVPLYQAVAASCAVPVVWPTVTIKGRRYMDGGMRSGTNADLAKGYAKVLVIAPIVMPDDAPALFGSNLKMEKEMLTGQGSRVLVLNPDQAALDAIGLNVLDPARREPAAKAGLAQGHTLIEQVRDFWTS